MIDYNDSTHTYSYRGRRYLSATQLIERFSHEFKSEEQAALFAYKHGKTAQYWLERWEDTRDKALDRGNGIHNLREDITRNRSFDVVHGTPFRVRNIEQYPPDVKLIDLPDGVYPEMKLWRHDYGIAGRSDKVIFESRDLLPSERELYRDIEPKKWQHRRAHIQDYKTNRFIRMRSFLHPAGRQMMLAPLSHLEDCDFIHYELQLSLYQYMLEYHGFQPGERTIIHFPHIPAEAPPGATEPSPVTYTCRYLRNEVISLLDYLKHRRIL